MHRGYERVGARHRSARETRHLDHDLDEVRELRNDTTEHSRTTKGGKLSLRRDEFDGSPRLDERRFVERTISSEGADLLEHDRIKALVCELRPERTARDEVQLAVSGALACEMPRTSVVHSQQHPVKVREDEALDCLHLQVVPRARTRDLDVLVLLNNKALVERRDRMTRDQARSEDVLIQHAVMLPPDRRDLACSDRRVLNAGHRTTSLAREGCCRVSELPNAYENDRRSPRFCGLCLRPAPSVG